MSRWYGEIMYDKIKNKPLMIDFANGTSNCEPNS